MPSNVVAGIAKKSGKSEAEVEKLWDKAKAAAKEQYPEVAEDSDRFYQIVTGILKNMAGIKESFEELVGRELETLNEVCKKKLHEEEGSEKKDMEDSEDDEEVEDEEEEDESKKKEMKKSEDDEEVEDDEEEK